MAEFPDDIFTEPEIDPDTLSNLGPLRGLAGIWQSDTGTDIAPKEDGPEKRRYIERIEMQPIDPQPNGPQLLYGLRYHVHINTEEEDITFHDQTGYWLWEPATGMVLQTIAIPRGQVALAEGHAAPDASRLVLDARRRDTRAGICSAAFLEHAFRTEAYHIEVTFHPDGSWSYVQSTTLIVRGLPFDHRDENRLVKIGEPTPNPLLLRVQAKGG